MKDLTLFYLKKYLNAQSSHSLQWYANMKRSCLQEFKYGRAYERLIHVILSDAGD